MARFDFQNSGTRDFSCVVGYCNATEAGYYEPFIYNPHIVLAAENRRLHETREILRLVRQCSQPNPSRVCVFFSYRCNASRGHTYGTRGGVYCEDCENQSRIEKS